MSSDPRTAWLAWKIVAKWWCDPGTFGAICTYLIFLNPKPYSVRLGKNFFTRWTLTWSWKFHVTFVTNRISLFSVYGSYALAKFYNNCSWSHKWALLVGQLVEKPLLTPKICGSNPDNKKICLFFCQLVRKDKNEENIPVLAQWQQSFFIIRDFIGWPASPLKPIKLLT